MNAKIIRLTYVDPTDPCTREVHTGQLRMEWKDSYELEDGRRLRKSVQDRDVSVEILGYAAPPKGTMVVSWVDDDKDEYFGVYAFGSDSYLGYNRGGECFGVYAFGSDSYRGHTREGVYGVLLVVNGLVDYPWKVIA